MKENEESENFFLLPVANKEVPSQFTSQYLQFYGLSKEKFNELKQETMEEAQKMMTLDRQRNFRSKVLIKVVSCSKGCEFMHFQVNLGSFIFPRIDVFNRKASSQTHSLFFSCAGSFGRVYRAHSFQQEIAIKCFSYKPNTFRKVLSEALSEYCFLKLASFLRVGPKLPKKQGYQLIIYEDCIEFAMEYCQQIFYSTEIGEKQGQQLKESLLKLHHLNSVHLDIKPDNIRYSTSFQKYVFIDFGFTRFVKEDLGFKTITNFKGTATYCSEEMEKLYELRKEGYVDLYFNDVKGLSNVLSNDNNQKSPPEEDFMEQKEKRRAKFSVIEDITVHHMKYSIQYSLSQGALSAAKYIFEEYKRVHQSRIQNEMCKKAPLVTYEETLEQINDQKQQESDASFIQSVINQIFCINEHSSLGKTDIWNEDKNYEIKVICNAQGQAQKEKQSYYHILSRILKINSTKYTFQQKKSLARTAIEALGITQTEIFEGKQWKSCPEISHLSKLLLEFSLEANAQSRAQIFINVMFNIFAFEILDFDEAVHCFQRITRQIHDKTIEMMIAFYKGFCILFYLTDQFDVFQKCQVEIQIIAMQFIEELPQSAFKQVLCIIFSFESAKKKPEIQKNMLQGYKEKTFYEQLQDFASQRRSLAQFLEIFEEKTQYEIQLDQILKKSIQKSLKRISFQFQHFHFLWILKCYAQDKHEEYQNISKQFLDIFQEKCIRFIKIQLIDMTYSLQESPTKTIYAFYHLLQQMKNKKYNKKIEKNLNGFIQKILFKIPQIFKKIDQKCQSSILEFYSKFKVNISKDHIPKSAFNLLFTVRNAISLKQIYPQFYRQYTFTNQLGQKVNIIYSHLKTYYEQLRQLVLKQNDTSLIALLFVISCLHILKQNFTAAEKMYNNLCPVIVKIKNLRYLDYQSFFNIFQKFTQNIEGKQQIYQNYIDLIDSNNHYDHLLKSSKTLSLVLSYLQENSSKKLPIFINTIARCLIIYNEKAFVNNYIKVLLVSLAYKPSKSSQKYEILKSASIAALDRIEPISENPYNSLFFFQMISLDFLKADPVIFVRIFKAFPFIKSNAQEYMCRTIYEKYFATFHKELPKRKAKKILFKAIINQPNMIQFQEFIQLFKLKKHRIANIQQKSLQKHLKIFYNNQVNRVHYTQSLQKRIVKARKRNLKAAFSQIYMQHLNALKANS